MKDKDKFEPMLAETAEGPFNRDGWLFEVKYDGARVIAIKEASKVRLLSRSGRDVTINYPEVVQSLEALPIDDFVIDGEVVAMDERGRSSFERLQQRSAQRNEADVARVAAEIPVVLFAFDLLSLEGHDTRSLPLTNRKELLSMITPAGAVHFASHIEREGKALFEMARKNQMEGIIAKRADSAYQTGQRTRDWLKVKVHHTADLAVVGYKTVDGNDNDLGALVLAWRDGDSFAYAGKCGSGIDTETRKVLLAKLRDSERKTPAFSGGEAERDWHFVEPEIVVEIRHLEVTKSGHLRQPAFLRVRDDKTPRDANTAP